MDHCIDFLWDAKVCSTLDCNSGYWQIPVGGEDRDKTTFVCYVGAYRYIHLPFGLSNAAATFQRAIDMILGGPKWKSCLVYLDDIIFLLTVGGRTRGTPAGGLHGAARRGCLPEGQNMPFVSRGGEVFGPYRGPGGAEGTR